MGGRAQTLLRLTLDPAGLKAVLGIEGQAGRAAQRLRGQPFGEPLLRKIGTGRRQIPHRAERNRIAPRDRAHLRRHRRAHLAAPQPIGAVVLIVDHQIKQQITGVGQRAREPCGEAVGVHRDAHPCRRVCGFVQRQFAHHLRFQKPNILGMFGQPCANRGAGAGRAAIDQRGANAVFQRLDTLGNRGRRDPQFGGGGLETAALQDRGQGVELIGIERH